MARNWVAPSNLSKYSKKFKKFAFGDIYVSEKGKDTGDGSMLRPFLTIERARDELRAIRASGKATKEHYIISVEACNLTRIDNPITFTQEDSNTTYVTFGDWYVNIRGCVRVQGDKFKTCDAGASDVFCVEMQALDLPADAFANENPPLVCENNVIMTRANSLAEINGRGMYFADVQSNVLYVCPNGKMNRAEIEIALSEKPLIVIDNAENMTFDGFDLMATKGCGVYAKGNNLTFKSCSFKGIGDVAIYAEGVHNTVSECEIAYMAASGIKMIAGDKPTLTPGFAVVDNCLIHDVGMVTVHNTEAVSIVGVHNKVSHNEIYNTPFRAIHYSGQNHLIEYNYIHEAVQKTEDMGTTYSGYHWESQGCVLRYNCLYNIGNEDFRSVGIYFDDMLGGQTAYGNAIINCWGHGFLIGGGRDHVCYNNMVLNAGGYSLMYDQRGRDWEKEGHIDNRESGIWCNLRSVPYTSQKWADKFPSLARVNENADEEDVNFPANPANSKVFGNLLVSEENYSISESVTRYSDIFNNCAMSPEDDIGFIDIAKGDYSLKADSPVYEKLHAFENIPFEKIGRY